MFVLTDLQDELARFMAIDLYRREYTETKFGLVSATVDRRIRHTVCSIASNKRPNSSSW